MAKQLHKSFKAAYCAISDMSEKVFDDLMKDQDKTDTKFSRIKTCEKLWQACADSKDAEIEKLKDDLRFALSFTPKAKAVEGLDPTFYYTLTYEGDLRIDERLDRIKKELNQGNQNG